MTSKMVLASALALLLPLPVAAEPADAATQEAASVLAGCLVKYERQMEPTGVPPADFERMFATKCVAEQSGFGKAGSAYFIGFGTTDGFMISNKLSEEIAKMRAIGVGGYTEAFYRRRKAK